MVSQRKKTNMKYSAIIGAVVGVAVFAVTYMVNPNLIYIIFIPIAAAMGWAIQYTKYEEPDD